MKRNLPSENPQPSAAVNCVMQFLMKMSGMLLSFVSYPYIFRTLGADSYGKVAFATAVLNILTIFANMGIPVYGTRECAKVRDDRQRLMAAVKDFLCIQGVLSGTVFVVLLAMILFSPQMKAEPALFLIQGAALLAQAINTEWFYAALERYSYIAVRTSVVKALFVALMFLLVKHSSDYLIYAALLVGPILVSNAVNLIPVCHMGPFQRGMDWRRVKSHLKPALLFFAQAVAISIYTNIDSIMLEFFENSYSVGIYDTAVKIKLVLSYMVTSLSTVMFPKMSYYLSSSREDKFYDGVLKTMRFSAVIAIPLWIFVAVTAKDLLLLLYGSAPDNAVVTLRILIPTILLIGFSHITGVQMLIPMGRERQAALSYAAGAMVNIVCNSILIPRFSIAGAAAATLLAEAVVLAIQMAHLGRAVLNPLKKVRFAEVLFAAVCPCPTVFLLRDAIAAGMPRLAVMGAAYGLLFSAALFLMFRGNQSGLRSSKGP